ncbi:hypothetical protein GCM10010303_57050 [Streptomyces purpurascens]|nr:hypothetical protein GCM10010303_57050 [Streptomyces purpurascens]
MVESSAASAIESISAATTAPRRPVVAGGAASRAAELVLPTPGASPSRLPAPCTYLPKDSFPLGPPVARPPPLNDALRATPV